MVAVLLHAVRGIVAVGIFTTVAIVSAGNFFTGLRAAVVDCSEGATHNGAACAVDLVEASLFGFLTVAFTSAAVVGTAFLPRDNALDAGEFHMAHVDGVAINKWDVFNRDWMNKNLREGERKYILANTTNLAPDGGKVMTEAWLENGTMKLTQYPHQIASGKEKRSREVYLHYSAEYSTIAQQYPNIKTSYVDARNAAQHIFDDMANRQARSNCIGLSFEPPGGLLTGARFGFEGSYAYTNDAPTNCPILPAHSDPQMGQIGDFYITSY